MNKRLRYLFVALAVTAVFTACKKEDVQAGLSQINGEVMQANISGVNGPTSGKPGETLTFNLLWHNTQQGLWFDHIGDSTASVDTRIVKIYSVIRTDSIPTDSVPRPISYNFKAPTAGTYYLKFYKVENTDKSAIIDTVVIK